MAAILADLRYLFDDLVHQSADARDDIVSKGTVQWEKVRGFSRLRGTKTHTEGWIGLIGSDSVVSYPVGSVGLGRGFDRFIVCRFGSVWCGQ